MVQMSLLRKLGVRIRRFGSDRRGNVVTMFALTMVPMVGIVGAAVDYSRANSIKAAMQAAADATALMLSKEASGLTNAQLQTKANNYFKALLNRPEANGLSIAATYDSSNGNQVVVKAASDVKTKFMGLLGFSSLKIGADSQVKWGNSRLRVALVLDNTGSMSNSGKIDALKTASNNLLDQLKSAAINKDDVYVSIIPFAKDVNIGSTNKGKNWIDWTEWDAKNGSCSNAGYSDSQSNCTSHGGTWKSASHNTWNGCVLDRGGYTAPSLLNTDTNVTAPNKNVADTKFPADQYDSCPQSVLPLSNDWTAMKALIGSMSPAGMTNQAIGLAHGWMSLVGGGPYPKPPKMDPKYKYSQIIILMSDGLNTEDRWYSDEAKIDARQKMTCSNVKAAGFTVYAIHVNTDGDPLSTLLKECASAPDKFWMLTSPSALVATFQQIGTQLSNLRISQ